MMIKKQLRTGLLLLVACSLGACLKSNPPVQSQRFSLPEVSAVLPKPPSANAAKQTLVLNRIQLADYLDTDRIVVQLDDVTLHPARDHLWVDNLSQELRRGLRARLSSRLPDTAIIDPLAGAPAATSLQLTIDQFHGQIDGYAVLSGQWQLLSADHKPLQSHSFKFTTPLAESGYPALVRALGNNLDLLSAQIAGQ
ncbi:MAG: PqiC family protein [Methylophilus sp.]|uniref:PqiC family protein n=1 Tax=Methylophilus sp. TaxID=29541 RepID=UPI003FA1914A